MEEVSAGHTNLLVETLRGEGQHPEERGPAPAAREPGWSLGSSCPCCKVR